MFFIQKISSGFRPAIYNKFSLVYYVVYSCRFVFSHHAASGIMGNRSIPFVVCFNSFCHKTSMEFILGLLSRLCGHLSFHRPYPIDY